jgi:hypothetical protein
MNAESEYEPLLTEMLALYPDLVENGPRDVRDGWRKVAHLAPGWYLRCHRSVEALLLLDSAGFDEEASPLRRSMIEHVVALRWLAVEGDGIVNAVARGHAVTAQRIHDAVALANWTSIDLDEMDQVVASAQADARDPSNDNLLNFAHRVKEYGDVHVMPGYLAECAHTHPTYESAMSYVEVPSGLLLSEPRRTRWQVPFSTTELLQALLAVQGLFNPAPWTDILPGIVQRYKDITDRVRTEQGLAPVDWTGPPDGTGSKGSKP